MYKYIGDYIGEKLYIRTPCNLDLDLYVFICSKMGVIWKCVCLQNLRMQLWTDFDRTWINLFGKSTILVQSTRFSQFLPHFFLKRQKICIWISEMSFFMLWFIFLHFMKKGGKNRKKRLGGARMDDFLNKLLQVLSKSVHYCIHKWCKRTNFHITPIFEQIKYIKVKVKVTISKIFFIKLSLENTNWHQFLDYLHENWIFRIRKLKKQDSL